MARETNKRLFEILDECTFQPVMRKQEKGLTTNGRYKLSEVKSIMSRQRERFHNCSSDEEVYQRYHEYLDSKEAEELKRELHGLDLPALPDCRAQFDTAADALFNRGIGTLGD